MMRAFKANICTIQEEHVRAVNRILQYLKGSPRKGVMIKKKKKEREKCTEHVDVNRYYTEEKLTSDLISTPFTPTKLN